MEQNQISAKLSQKLASRRDYHWKWLKISGIVLGLSLGSTIATRFFIPQSNWIRRYRHFQINWREGEWTRSLGLIFSPLDLGLWLVSSYFIFSIIYHSIRWIIFGNRIKERIK